MTIGIIPGPLTELNFDLVWARVVDQGAKAAFIGTPQKVRLERGFLLYKFTEFQLVSPRGTITEWWSPVEPYGIDPGMEARIHLAQHLHASPADLARVVAAVKENWNALTHVLEARLLMPVYGFWGQCSQQDRLQPGRQARPGIAAPPARDDLARVRGEHLPGYAWQFYIPHLTTAHIQQVAWRPL